MIPIVNVHDIVSCIPYLKLWHNDFNCNVFLYIIFKTTTELKHNPNNYIYLYRDIMVPNCKTNEMNYHEYSIWIPIHTNITISTKHFQPMTWCHFFDKRYLGVCSVVALDSLGFSNINGWYTRWLTFLKYSHFISKFCKSVVKW